MINDSTGSLNSPFLKQNVANVRHRMYVVVVFPIQGVGKSWINYNQCEVSDVGREGKFYNPFELLS